MTFIDTGREHRAGKHENAVIPEVCDEEPLVDGVVRDALRRVHSRRAGRWRAGIEIGLTDDNRRGLPIRERRRIEDHYAVVRLVSDEKSWVRPVKQEASRAIHCRGRDAAVGWAFGERRAPKNKIGRVIGESFRRG